MRVKRLDVTGFKSFNDRTVINFDDGVTGIVGPNGCGKSNVVDAIRWVMGEQSAKHLRGRSMEDVLFNGSEAKPPTSMAEVSLTFLNDGQGAPPQYQAFSEITVTRRLFRNGDSDYFINKTHCRLLDIVELFLGTGVGTKAYSIVEQGRVGLIVSAKPEDRRTLIEEAAGVTKYKSRRKAAERKMEFTEQNLLRVSDVVSEMEKRLDSLNRQAKKAERYKRMKGELREIELHLASHKWLELTALRQVASCALGELAQHESDQVAKVAAADAEIAARRLALVEEERGLAGLRERAFHVEQGVKVAETSLKALSREQEDSQLRLGGWRSEREGAVAQAQAREEERKRLEESLASLSGRAAEGEASLKQKEAEARQLAEEQAVVVAKLEAERGGLVGAASRVASLKSHAAALARQAEDLAARLARVQVEQADAAKLVEELSQRRERLVQQLSEGQQLKLSLASRKEQQETQIIAAKKDLGAAEAGLFALRQELAERRSRLNSLREIEHNYESYGRGVRAVMQRVGEQPREHGVLGPLASLLTVPAEVEVAIEAALGDRLNAVVVQDEAAAVELVCYLSGEHAGRGSFLPRVPATGVAHLYPKVDPSLEGLVGEARRFVSCPQEVQGLVSHLLAGVLVVKDLAAAARISRGLPHTLVTLDGELVEPWGAISGGMAEGQDVGLLHKRREMVELEQAVKGLEADLVGAQEHRGQLSDRVKTLEGELSALARSAHEEDLKLAAHEKDHGHAQKELVRARELHAALALEGEQLEKARGEAASEQQKSAAEISAQEQDQSSREAASQLLRDQLVQAQARAEAVAEALTQARVAAAADRERRDAARAALDKLATAESEAGERQQRLEASIASTEKRLEEVAQEIARNTGERDRLLGEGEVARDEVSAAVAAYERSLVEVNVLEAALKEQRKGQEEIKARSSEQTMKERELTLSLEHLTHQVRERQGVDIAMEIGRFHDQRSPGEEGEAKLTQLREGLERMGEVNLTAIEEYEEVGKRHAFLTAQKEDLERSLTQLRSAIVRINRASRARFAETFEAVNARFQDIFPRLFNGGKASLQMIEGDDVLEAGIEIFAQPPGKKLQSISLLSGGEKALTAISMLFAIFLIKPTPFCLLDEVDAPLDDANVGRYNDIVKEMSRNSQFILITHNKRTMEIADTLYGVTMEEPGVSKLVSVKISEVVSRAA